MTDYTELSVSDEGTAVETFTWTPDYVVPVKERFDSRVQPFEDGYAQTFPKFSKTRRSWSLRFMNRTEAEKNAIEAFFEARVGAEEAFYWTPIDESSASKVCFEKSSIKSTKVNPDIYRIQLTIEELF